MTCSFVSQTSLSPLFIFYFSFRRHYFFRRFIYFFYFPFSLRHVEYLKIRIPPLKNSIKPSQYSSANWRKYKIDRPNNMRSSARVSLLLSSKLFFLVFLIFFYSFMSLDSKYFSMRFWYITFFHHFSAYDFVVNYWIGLFKFWKFPKVFLSVFIFIMVVKCHKVRSIFIIKYIWKQNFI